MCTFQLDSNRSLGLMAGWHLFWADWSHGWVFLFIFILCRVPVGTRSDDPDNHRTAQCTMSFISYPLGGDIEVYSVNRRVGAHKARLLPMEEVGQVEPKSVIRPTFQSNSSFSGLFMPYQHFFMFHDVTWARHSKQAFSALKNNVAPIRSRRYFA